MAFGSKDRRIGAATSSFAAVLMRAGHAVMRRLFARTLDRMAQRASDLAERQSYSVASIVLAAKLAKCDGVVSRTEIDAFKSVFRIEPDELADVARVWNAARLDARGFEPYAHRLALLFAGDRATLENVLGALVHVARADGDLNADELRFLERVCSAFGLDRAALHRQRAKIERPEPEDPYRVLGLPHDASDDDVKRAWRRMVRVYHPDTVIASGAAHEFVELAERKTAKINSAYAAITRARLRAA